MDESLSRRIGLRRGPDEVPAEARPAPDFAGHNAFASDPILTAVLDAVLDEGSDEELKALGAYWGSAEAQEVARIANAHVPTLRQSDFDCRRIDQVEMHPAYHALMNRSVTAGLMSAAWEDGEERRQHRLRAAALYLTAQCERGHLVPVSASHAAVAALAYASELEGEIFPLLASRRYDRRPLPLADKEGASITLATAERASGADRATAAMRGELAGGDRVAVSGTQWFVAAPSCDAMLALARTPEGSTAVMIPRFAPENDAAIRISSLLDMSGLAAQAVACIEFEAATARLVGEPGRGQQVLRDVRTLTQLDSAIIAAGAARAAVARAGHHARYHHNGAGALIRQPLQSRLIADLALESAALTALAIRLATAFDQAFDRDGDHAVARLVTPAARIYALKAAAGVATEACEAIGGIAFVASHPAARIRADLGALAQWDGSASDAALEVTSLLERDQRVLRDALDELGADLGKANADLIEATQRMAERAKADAAQALAFAEQLAMVAAASAMRKSLPRPVADAYVATRLRERFRTARGAIDGRFDAASLIESIIPED